MRDLSLHLLDLAQNSITAGADLVTVRLTLAEDGMLTMELEDDENCIRVLEEIEDNRLKGLEFFEGAACTGGCVGGPLNFENNYVARAGICRLSTRDPNADLNVDSGMMTKYPLYDDKRIMPNSAMKLDDDLMEAARKMERIEKIYKELPGFDCGSCGSPTCRTFAEDIVQGDATKMDCIHKMKEQLRVMAQQMVDLAQTTRE